MYLLPMHDFVASGIGHFENICSLKLNRSSKSQYISLYNNKKVKFVHISASFIRRVLKYWEAVKFMIEDSSFIKFKFFPKSSF